MAISILSYTLTINVCSNMSLKCNRSTKVVQICHSNVIVVPRWPLVENITICCLNTLLKCNRSTKVVIKFKHEYEEHCMTYVFNMLVCIITLHKISR